VSSTVMLGLRRGRPAAGRAPPVLGRAPPRGIFGSIPV